MSCCRLLSSVSMAYWTSFWPFMMFLRVMFAVFSWKMRVMPYFEAVPLTQAPLFTVAVSLDVVFSTLRFAKASAR